MDIHCKYDELLTRDKLLSHPKNRNKHPPEQVARLAQILKYQGWRYPVKVSKRSGYVTSGHGRIEAAWLNGWNTVPVNFQEYESEEQEYADVTADNAIASWAELDLAGINADLGELGPDFDIDLLGIEDFVLEPADKGGLTDEDSVPERTRECQSQVGDLFLLGTHRLLCGDSTDHTHVERLMNGEKADMVFTDPPFGIDLETDYSQMGKSADQHWAKSSKRGKYKAIENDNIAFDCKALFECFGYVEEIFVCGANNFIMSVPGCEKGSWVVWDKKVDENLDRMFNGDFELFWSKKRHKYAIARIKMSGLFGLQKEDTRSRIHPTQKPVRLAEWFFDRWGKDAKLIWDGYLGSGSTLIACEKSNRKCYGMEIDPHYCDVIIERWEKYTGKKAEKIG